MVDGTIISLDRKPRSPYEECFNEIFGSPSSSDGMPDRIFIVPTGVVGIEIKGGNEPIKPSQWLKAEEFHRNGWHYLVLRIFMRSNRVKGPKFVFSIQRYVGYHCFQGITFDEFATRILLDEKVRKKIGTVDNNSLFQTHIRFSGLILATQVGPLYQAKSKYSLSIEDRVDIANRYPILPNDIHAKGVRSDESRDTSTATTNDTDRSKAE